ncbi:MAG: 50S ribosome-binding GTPase [DPANN group archaeon]|nr:50S ribosome-binding GTPase [DPANN group archaeon]
MPSNVDQRYIDAEKHYYEATTNEEKLKTLQEMLSAAPSHKGAEVMKVNIKERISKFKALIAAEKKRRKGGYSIAVKKMGFQIVLIGFPNSGKSTFLKKMTNADPAIAAYPFTTQKPEVGMLDYDGAQLQLVEVPALVEGAADKQAELMSIVLNSDGIIMIAENEDQETTLKNELKEFGVPQRLMVILKGQEVRKQDIFNFFGLIRVYTKEPGDDPIMDKPIVMRYGSTLLDAAREIHKDFAKKFKFAKVWGSSKFPGQRVEKLYILQDKDVIELHAER